MKNFVIISFLAWSGISSLLAMEQSHALTPAEKSCYEWFGEQQKHMPPFYDRLSEQDRAIINKQVKYNDDPEGVTRCRYKIMLMLFMQ